MLGIAKWNAVQCLSSRNTWSWSSEGLLGLKNSRGNFIRAFGAPVKCSSSVDSSDGNVCSIA